MFNQPSNYSQQRHSDSLLVRQKNKLIYQYKPLYVQNYYYDFLGFPCDFRDLTIFTLNESSPSNKNCMSTRNVLLSDASKRFLYSIKQNLDLIYYAYIMDLLDQASLKFESLTDDYYTQIVSDVERCITMLEQKGIDVSYIPSLYPVHNNSRK